MPDFAPRSCIKEIENKSYILPVPIENSLFQNRIVNTKCKEGVHLVWNHRWEYDKGPEVLLHTLQQLLREKCPFSLSLVGQQFSRRPEAFDSIQKSCGQSLVHFGYLKSKEEYLSVLHTADCVLSTAHHDFQGLAMMDAIALGCIPFAPNRLAYPEYIPAQNLFDVSDSPEKEGSNLAQKIKCYFESPSQWDAVNLTSYSETELWPKYHSLLGIPST